MLQGQIRLDKTRYMTILQDAIIQVYNIGSSDWMFYKTEHGNILICRQEPYQATQPCEDNGRLFEMVIAIKTRQGTLVPSKVIEDVLNTSIRKTSAKRLLNIIDKYHKKFDNKDVLDALQYVNDKFPIFEL